MKKNLALAIVILVFFVAAVVLSGRKSTVKDLSEVSEQVSITEVEEEALPEEETTETLVEAAEPDIIFYTLEGEEFSYTDLIAYPKAVLFIWTTRCGVCKDELQRLSQNCTEYEGVKVFFVNAGEDPEQIKSFLSYYGIKDCVSDKIMLDRQAHVARKFYISNVPTVIFFEYATPIYKGYVLNRYLIEKVYEEE